MPFIPNTPEAHAAILSPSSPDVCRGISNDGKQCKRVRNQSGVITTVGKEQAWFCARHQDQAKEIVLRHTASFAHRRALAGRGSLDTLIEQVELLVAGNPSVKTTVVSTTQKVGPEKDPFVQQQAAEEAEPPPTGTPAPPSPPGSHHAGGNKKQGGLLRRLLMCCFGSSDDELEEDLEKNWDPKRREAELRSAAAQVVAPQQAAAAPMKKPAKTVAFQSVAPTPPLPMMYPPKQPQSAITKPAKSAVAAVGLSPATPQSSDDEVEELVPPVDVSKLTKEQQSLLKLIPKTVHSYGLGRLQNELLKPFSSKDEPGYIYMFWLTNSPFSPFSSPGGTPNGGPISNVDRLLHTAANAVPSPGGTRPKLLFKIGRAVNVQRRLHQWSAQCGYNLSLIRYYPHTSASTPPGAQVARTVPNVNRIERLIHLELSATPGANPRKHCEACGKTHQEWFEVEASKEGILAVDGVIKRWIAYGERSAGTNTAPATTATLQVRPPAPARKNADAPGGVKMYKTKPSDPSPKKPDTKTPSTPPKKSPAATPSKPGKSPAGSAANSLAVPTPQQQRRSRSSSAAHRSPSSTRQGRSSSTSRQGRSGSTSRQRSTSRQPPASSSRGRRKGRRRNGDDDEYYDDDESASEDSERDYRD
ncbi:meiotically up-regulated gene 113-domain-containing protein [Sphaerosporella brunnea]|uniref:Meiotically up-regulated gene 113-domain-containing protein n=1 Tax=Sphaerosporella brunnea TaxID=1250544 RepID=A0A5J5F3K2_9PEZI|nr:meiotically up-regulated gene 113-domain-containing protein [Sphaerosporella brunnea]